MSLGRSQQFCSVGSTPRHFDWIVLSCCPRHVLLENSQVIVTQRHFKNRWSPTPFFFFFFLDEKSEAQTKDIKCLVQDPLNRTRILIFRLGVKCFYHYIWYFYRSVGLVCQKDPQNYVPWLLTPENNKYFLYFNTRIVKVRSQDSVTTSVMT